MFQARPSRHVSMRSDPKGGVSQKLCEPLRSVSFWFPSQPNPRRVPSKRESYVPGRPQMGRRISFRFFSRNLPPCKRKLLQKLGQKIVVNLPPKSMIYKDSRQSPSHQFKGIQRACGQLRHPTPKFAARVQTERPSARADGETRSIGVPTSLKGPRPSWDIDGKGNRGDHKHVLSEVPRLEQHRRAISRRGVNLL